MSEAERIREAYRHCEALVRTLDKDRFLAALFAPADRRPFLYALYAFAGEIARVQDRVREPMAGVIRLQWWADAISGLRPEEAAGSPVMIALQDMARQTALQLESLVSAVEARQAELHGIAAVPAAAAIFTAAAWVLDAEAHVTAVVEDAAKAVTFVADPHDPYRATYAYNAFRAHTRSLPQKVLPVFLTVALVPLLLRNRQALQWRRQLTLLRAAWFGFPKPIRQQQ